MKRLTITLLTILLILPLAYISAAIVEGKLIQKADMNCKVTGQSLIQSVDGVSKTYSSFEEGLEVGDTFIVSFRLGAGLAKMREGDYSLKVSARSNDPVNTINFFVKVYELSKAPETPFLEWDSYGVGTSTLEDGSFYFSGRTGFISGERYYKNDWHIQFNNNAYIGKVSHVVTANCMNVPSTFDDIFNKIKSHHSKEE